MESPVVVDKPPEFHGNTDNRGFPFDDEDGTGAWSELAARHPDIAARLRQRPATWARKRRPSSQDPTEDFGDNFSGFNRFPFDDIPPEFREHFPSHWNRRFGSREEQPPTQIPHQNQNCATQTEQKPGASQQEPILEESIPQYGLRNTVDLGQKSPADPSLVDADNRSQRSMSAPPGSHNQTQSDTMSGQNQQEQPATEQQPNVRHIPIFVEGRDQVVINKDVDHGTHFGDVKPPPSQPHIDRDQYFADDSPSFHQPPNFSRAFGTPFNKGFRQGPQPFVQQKVYPQTAFARGASPQRSQSPKPQLFPEEHYVKVPVHHEHATPKPSPKQTQAPPQQQQQHPPKQQTPPEPPKPQPTPPDPITQILAIQTDVLNLMTEVENFTGAKNDKRYMYLDEMLTRNLIKLDTIETDGKENIRQARKEAIKCIQKCIAVLEAKAEKGGSTPQPQQDVEMKENSEKEQAAENQTEQNGELEMKEAEMKEVVDEPKEPESTSVGGNKEEPTEMKAENDDAQPQIQDTRPESNSTAEQPTDKLKTDTQQNADKKSTKKCAKNVKKRDKSKDKKDKPKDSNKEENESSKNEENMQVDEKDDKSNSQMDVDIIPASQ